MESTKVIGAIIIGIIIAAIGLLAIFGKSEQASEKTSSEISTNSEQQLSEASSDEPGVATGIPASEVATHNSAEDCWAIIDDKVYDLTPAIADHPGGEEILRACGGDGSQLFNTRITPEGEELGEGGSHSAEAREQLADLYIGDLAN